MEKIVESVRDILENERVPFILFLVFAAVLLAAAAIGGAPQLPLPQIDPFWRYLIGAVAVVMLTGCYPLLKAKSESQFSEKKFGVTIQTPQPNTTHKAPIPVVGSIKKKLPNNARLWIFTVRANGSSPRYWPHDEAQIDEKLIWRAKLRASRIMPKAKRQFAIFIVGENGQALIQHYKLMGQAIDRVEPAAKRNWPGIEKLTGDTVRVSEDIEVSVS